MGWFADFINAIFGGGGKPKPPEPPATREIHVNFPGVEPTDVRLNDQGDFPMVKDHASRFTFTVPSSQGQFNLHARAVGKKPLDQVITVPSAVADIIVGGLPSDYTDQAMMVVPGFQTARPTPMESGSLIADGRWIRTSTGALWQSRFITDFLLLYRFLTGEDIRPIIEERVALGFNGHRVLGMVDWAHKGMSGKFWPQSIPDYYPRLPEFAALLASYGQRFEYVAGADAQIIMPNPGELERHFDQARDAFGNAWNLQVDGINEPFKNVKGGAQRAYDLASRWQGHGPLVASGAGIADVAEGDFEQLKRWTLDLCTIHDHDRGPEWPRKSKNAQEVREGLRHAGREVTVLMNEPMGAAEVAKPGSRSDVPEDFGYASGVLALQAQGGTMHLDAGIDSILIGESNQKRCCEEWIEAALFVGADAPAGSYTAGHLGDCPIEHSDSLALRTFAQIAGGSAIVVVVRPGDGWVAKPKDGWRIVEQAGPRGAYLKMER